MVLFVAGCGNQAAKTTDDVALTGASTFATSKRISGWSSPPKDPNGNPCALAERSSYDGSDTVVMQSGCVGPDSQFSFIATDKRLILDAATKIALDELLSQVDLAHLKNTYEPTGLWADLSSYEVVLSGSGMQVKVEMTEHEAAGLPVGLSSLMTKLVGLGVIYGSYEARLK